MPSLKETRTRITSVNSTMQITSAMKMVSAAKLKKAQDKITQMRPYASKLEEMLSHLAGTMADMENPLVVDRPVKRVLLIPINSNRGLCGAFNANVIKGVTKLIENDYSDAQVTLFPFGKKAYDWFKKSEWMYAGGSLGNPENNAQIYDDLSYENAASRFEPIMDAFAAGEFDEVVVVYNRFKNAATQITTVEKVLPVSPMEEEDASHEVDYIFQPDQEELLADLIPSALKTSFYKALLDSNASEHGARMTAMHKATDNASDMLSELKLTYNKARQAAITTEILEIVGGAEALKG
ncbi:ATP synthase F1 subunit gamma [bacterium SCSIO 12741]|nr:ATP synthase F1 subunit gamma [bacterium SCSIO 12741]